MSEFTAEDFAQVNLATKGEFGVARRTDPIREHQWHVYGGGHGWFSDEEMAASGWVPVVESRVTLDALEAAWEAAERATECRKGDVLISKSWKGGDNFRVHSARSAKDLPPGLRILSRAPREPWADLADSLEAEVQWIDRFNAVDAAQALHAAGWRKGGDES